MDEAVKNRIIELATRNGGRIEPDQVIEDARDVTSPLHGQFNWNVEGAAWEHWRSVARQLIRSVHVERVVNQKTVTTIAYVRDPEKPYHEQGYVSIALLRGKKDLAHAALLAEFSRCESALERALEVARALDLEKDIESLLRKVGLTRAKVTKRLATQ